MTLLACQFKNFAIIWPMDDYNEIGVGHDFKNLTI